MKHLLIGMVAFGALTISAPVLAQPATSTSPPGTTATPPAASTGQVGSRRALITGGMPSSRRGINLPGVGVPLTS